MKTHLRLLTLAGAFCVGLFTAAAADTHDHQHLATPKGGRVLGKTKPYAEVVIEKDRRVTIHFYSDDLKPVPATTQTATLIANAKSGKTTLEFEKRGDSLVSKKQTSRRRRLQPHRSIPSERRGEAAKFPFQARPVHLHRLQAPRVRLRVRPLSGVPRAGAPLQPWRVPLAGRVRPGRELRHGRRYLRFTS